MGILPLEFPQGETRKTLNLTGEERIHISGLQQLQPGAIIPLVIARTDGRSQTRRAVVVLIRPPN
ncbi:hypothetical protein ACLK2H_07480 [Escherichia coli]